MIPRLSGEFRELFGRASGGLLRTYRTAAAETIVVALGSVNGTIQDVVDRMREEGSPIGSVSVCSYRPFPLEALREALAGAKRVVVVEKDLAVGIGGILSTDMRVALSGLHLQGYTAIAGLGGRAITTASLYKLFREAERDELPHVTFLDLNWEMVNRQLEREKQQRRSGPTAENLLRDLGSVALRVL